MIIAVSDTHLGYDQSDSTKFLKFIDSKLMNLSKDDHLVLLGDILEFWRGKNIDAILPNYNEDDNEKKKENEQILSKIMELNKKTKVHYIIGNHDYTVINFLNNYNKNFPDNGYPIEIRKTRRLEEGSLKIFFMHGYEFEVISSFEPLTIEDYEKICIFLCDRTGKLVGKKLSFLWDLFNNRLNIRRRSLFKINSITKPPEERIENMDKIRKIVESSAVRQLLFGIRDDELLVFGHTHSDFICLEKNVVNTGSWLKYAPNRPYLKIKDENEDLLLVLNMDMCGETGFLPHNNTTFIDIDDGSTGTVDENNEMSEYFGQKMEQYAKDYTELAVEFDPIYASDYMPFEARGYVCIGAYDGSAIDENPHYHTQLDLPENLNMSFLISVTKMVLAFVLSES